MDEDKPMSADFFHTEGWRQFILAVDDELFGLVSLMLQQDPSEAHYGITMAWFQGRVKQLQEIYEYEAEVLSRRDDDNYNREIMERSRSKWLETLKNVVRRIFSKF